MKLQFSVKKKSKYLAIILLIATCVRVTAQKAPPIVKGYVVNDKGAYLHDANVKVTQKGTGASYFTATDSTGMFDFTGLEAGRAYDFEASYIGYNVGKVEGFRIIGDKSNSVIIRLYPSDKVLDDIVVVGYGSMKKRDILGSVSTLKASDIQKLNPPSIDAALQGMASGVSVTSSGEPGAPVQVKVRGINSISSGTNPLWIIDGIPVTSGALGGNGDSQTGFNGTTSQNILSMINPADIESIQVLKDAAATSIYGSRGSNGVILVTTKTGKQGTSSFDVDLRSGVSNWAKTDVGMASGKQWIQIMDLVRANSRMDGLYEPIQTLGQLDNYQSVMTREEALNTNTNWADQISRTGNFNEARLSASSGSEKSSSYLSLSYRKDNSNVKYNDLQTISTNVNLSYKPFNALTLGYRLIASYSDANRTNSDDGKTGYGGWAQINSNALPWMKVYDTAGINGYWNSQSYVNALASIDPRNSENTIQSLNLISGVSGDLKLPVKGLSLHGEWGVNLVNSKIESWISKNVRELGAQAQEVKLQYTTTNYNTYLNYDRSFNTDHHVNLVAGSEGTRSYVNTTSLTANNLVGTFHEIGTPGLLTGTSGLGGESYLMGIFGRANYDFQKKYYAGVSVRRDGISKFTAENRWANFMSGSLGWVITEEKFFKVKPINFLKLRGSYGQTGNTNIPTGITSDIWGIVSGSSALQGTNSTSLSNMGNTDIRWETTSTLDVGFDFGLLNNRINGSVAWYRQKIHDILLKVPLPLSAGITAGGAGSTSGNTIWENIGDMENHGLELNLDVTVIAKKNFRWNVGGNFATNRNKVLALDPQSDANGTGITPLSGFFGDHTYRVLIKKGLPLGNWYMAENAGVDPQKGIPLIYEVEKLKDGSTRHTGKIIPGTTTNMTNNQMILAGKTSIPKIMGGFNTNFSYKSLDLNIMWNFAAGHYIYNRLKQSLMTPNTGLLALSRDILTDTWKKPGDVTKYAMTVYAGGYFYDDAGNPSNTAVQYGSDNTTPNSLYLEKGDYLRLKNVQLGYSFPQQWSSAIHMKSIRAYVSGSNLLTFTRFSGYNPEVPLDNTSISSAVFFSSTPQTRTFLLGLSAKF